MGAACCGGGHSSGAVASKEESINGEVFDEVDHKKRHPQFRSVPFDVLVSGSSPTASPGASGQFPPSAVAGGGGAFGASFAAFDQSMYTMRGDASLSLTDRPNHNTFNLDSNMSFTNNFTDVSKDVVNMFLRNVKAIAEGGIKTNNMLEESVSMGAPGHAGGGPKVAGATESDMSAEDLDYINDGANLEDKLARLAEVEEVLRQNIYGSWNMNSALIQLAMLRVVPTLRERRQPWNRLENAAGAGADGSSPAAAPSPAPAPAPHASEKTPAKKPVLIVHAQGLELDQSSRGSEAAVSPPQGDLNVPAHKEDSPPAPSPKPPAKPLLPFATTPNGAMDPLNRSMSRSGIDPANAKVEHYELLALTCRGIDVNEKVGSKVIHDTWDFLADDANTNALNQGDCLFRFMCGTISDFDKETLDVINLFINRSAFADEEKENNTPRIDVYDANEAAKYICISVKAMYMLPGVKLANISVPVVASREYQKSCQPSANKLEDCDVKDTFRVTIGVIKFVFNLTVMFRVSEITDPNVLFSFKSADGIVPAKVIMLERTKRNVSKVDATAKVRSMLLYYPVNDGILVNSHTFVLNTSIPNMVAKLVNTFGSQGAAQSSETARLTRKYFFKTYGDSRKR